MKNEKYGEGRCLELQRGQVRSLRMRKRPYIKKNVERIDVNTYKITKCTATIINSRPHESHKKSIGGILRLPYKIKIYK